MFDVLSGIPTKEIRIYSMVADGKFEQFERSYLERIKKVSK